MQVFTYGSLMFPGIWRRVVRGDYRAVPALLRDHARFEVRGETYPGMVAQAGGRVEGVLYYAVDAADIAALDLFEGPEYRRQPVRVAVQGQEIEAVAYLYLMPEKLSDRPWLPEAFRMDRFIAAHCRPASK